MGEPASKRRETLVHLREESIRRLVDTERAMERGFNQARLFTSLAIALLLVGFLLVAQWRGNATLTTSAERQSDQDLALIIGQLTTENASLRQEILALEMRIIEAEQETLDRSEVLNQAAKELNALKVLTGLEPAVGVGVRVTVVDEQEVLLPQDFVALVHDLRAAGAEAIAINGVRVSALSGFAGEGTRIELDGTDLARDFEVVAIGNSDNLEQALALPGGLQATLSTFPGVGVDIERVDEAIVPAADQRGFTLGEPVSEDE